MLAYFPAGLHTAKFNGRIVGKHLTYRWINPTTGDSTSVVTTTEQILTVQKPQAGDWLLVARLASPPTPSSLPPPAPPSNDPPLFVEGVAPHPFSNETVLYLTLLQPGTVTVTVWDLLGRRILETQHTIGSNSLAVPVRVPHAGLYLYRVAYTTASGQSFRAAGTMVSVGRE